MLPLPTAYKVVAGASEGKNELTAFDRALLKAGIGNINLIRVSSILPPKAICKSDMVIPPGSLTPTGYGSIISTKPGQIISAAVAVGIAENSMV